METNLSIHLNEQTFAVLSTAAAAEGKTPAELAAAVVENVYSSGRAPSSSDTQAARKRFEQCFGSVDVGRPIGINNSVIDTDLAREYGSSAGTN
jgi:hypothetical protein